MLGENAFLPDSYQENTMVLLVQNPAIIFAYWELSKGQRQALAGHGDLYLRLYELNGGDCRPHNGGKMRREINLPPFTQNWYFTSLTPARSYCSELGYYGAPRHFYPILRSNRVETPPDGPSTAISGGRTVSVDVAAGVKPVREPVVEELPGSSEFYRRNTA
ncbi:DUF4912 domain-containing protein [Desulfotomaculum copahuensis]|uniref:DUF4912 domain-containing protein n=1 Tax=Desulfotomaculum copahuensis TaxID=1838280 RepID=A0A1B7LBZ6_9FIRM|nr:DUF4912 domain-containing protein [Desulfotomaculum copahuensis]OAT79979.1 hypothetical protein A6M21_14355 [Desulfotomaculum copahuensis]